MKTWLAVEVLDHMPPVYANDKLYWNNIDTKYGDELVLAGYASRVSGAANGLDAYAYRRTEAGERLLLDYKNGKLEEQYDSDITPVETEHKEESEPKECSKCDKCHNHCKECKQAYNDIRKDPKFKDARDRAMKAVMLYAIKPRIFWP